MGLSTIRAALAGSLGAIGAPFTAHTTVPDRIEPPAAFVTPGGAGEPAIRFDATMGRGSDEFTFTVTVLVQMADDQAAQEELDAYLEGDGERSVKAVIEADETLGGAVSFAHVREARNYGPVTYNDVRYLGVDFIIEVTA